MTQIIRFGVNLGFARFVWGPEAAIDIARDRLGLKSIEPVSESDCGPAAYLLDPAAFRARHEAAGRHARGRGMSITSVFSFYRDGGALAHPDPALRAAAGAVLESLAVQAAAAGAPYACASLMTANREDYAGHPELCRQWALEGWAQWMTFARQQGLKGLLVEMSAQPREECATIASTRDVLDWLQDWHLAHPDTTAPVELCYDVGHGISRAEAPDDAERDFRAWFRAFPTEIREIHVKNTDPEFLTTWPFTSEYDRRGIIRPADVVAGIRELLDGEILLMLEIAGKRGREIGEQRILDELEQSVGAWTRALRQGGYLEDADGIWRRR